ncbi:odorant receptor 94b-like [Bradysia coprophila]|uniref:odorant receptor 94b-like n=1 Tax=Bradysia coprophila TaxID=38358 RepID=UPI00187DB3A1|nr:odorant receptor 94b-like [Bradysia coprophila]
MHHIQVHTIINQILSVFYRIGFWNREDEKSPIKLRIKWFYLIYHFMVVVSAVTGSLHNENKDDRILLIETAVVNAVLTAKLWLTMWKQRQIFELLEQICTFTVRDREAFVFVNEKLKQFSNVTKLFIWIVAVLATFEVIAPFVGEKNLFFKIALPFDWRKNDLNYLLANAYICSAIILSCFCVLNTILLWYIMFNCSLRYQVLGIHITKMGSRLGEESKGILDKENVCRDDLSTLIKECLLTRKLVSDLESFCSTIVFIEIGTSGLCICGSIYCLAFDISESNVGRMIHFSSLLYNVTGIFITTNFGNEIMLHSNRLSYCLFKSDWFDQPQSTKMMIIILGECLKHPQTIVIAKLYPLTLETFVRILNFSYSTFNLLKTFRM